MSNTFHTAAPSRDDPADLDDSLRAEAPQIEDFDAYFAEEQEAAQRTIRMLRRAPVEPVIIPPVAFTFDPPEAPIAAGTRCFAKEQADADRFYVGSATTYQGLQGLGVGAGSIRRLNSPLFNRLVEEQRLGLWAHFMAPTVLAESQGVHLLINSYDRAAFTFGFYQLAAHTPGENLILLFRALLRLPNAKSYFPDLALDAGGRVIQMTAAGPKNLEREAQVTLSNGDRETQIPDFMSYLNPSTRSTEIREVLNAAKLMHWLRHDPAALDAAVRVPFEIMRAKIRKNAPIFALVGQAPELAIWVSDLKHHGRGGKGVNDKIKVALAERTLDLKLAALAKIDNYTKRYPLGRFLNRRKGVQSTIEKLRGEERFANVKFGEGALSLLA